MKWNYICVSEDKPAKNFKEEVIGTTEKRALFYDKQVGRRRIYRRDLDEKGKDWSVLKFRTIDEAKTVCDKINKTYNDDFKVGTLEPRSYTRFDMFRYAKFLKENKMLNNVNSMAKYDEEYPELTEKEKLKNLKNSLKLTPM